MFRRLFCLALCLLLALGALPAPSAAWAEGAGQAYDFNGDGQPDGLRYSVADTVLTLQVGTSSATIALNGFTDTYILAIADLDTSDAFVELVIGNEGNTGEYPASTTWQFWRYDGSSLYPLTVRTGAGESDRLTQYGYGGDSMRALKASGTGDIYVPSAGIVWIQPMMWDQEYAAYEEHYRLEDGQLVLQANGQPYPVSLQASLASTGDTPTYATTAALTLYAAPDRTGAAVAIPAGTLLVPVEATPSGWLRLRAADGTEGYIWQEPGWNVCLDAAGQDFANAVERLSPGQTPSVTAAPAATPAPEATPELTLMPIATPSATPAIAPGAISLGATGEGYITIEQARADFYTGRNRFGAGDELFYDRILSDPESYFMCLTAKEAVGGWQSTAAMVYNYAINGELQDIAEAAQEGMFEKLVLLDVLSSYTDISYQDSTSFDMAVDAFKEFVNVSGSVDDLLETLSDMEGVLPEGFSPAIASMAISLYEEGADWAGALANYQLIYMQRQQYIELLQGIRATNPDKYMMTAIDEIIATLSNESFWEGASDIYLQAGGNIASTTVLATAEELLSQVPQVKAVLAARKLTGTVINQFFDFSEFTVQMRTAEVLRRYETALVEVARQANADYLRDPSQENALRVCAMFDIVYRSLFYDLDAYASLSDVFEPGEASQNIADIKKSLRASYESIQNMDFELMRDRLNGITPIPDADPAVTWRSDYDKDGRLEAFYLAGESYNTLLGATTYAELWYSGPSRTEMVARTGTETFTDGRVFDVGERMLFYIEESTSAGNTASIWTVTNGVPWQAGLLSEDARRDDMRITGIEQQSEKEFTFYCESYDYSDGAGRTVKRYYMYWDGSGFTEYGGLRITEAQLRAVNGASTWLDGIIASGGTIGDIFYRENGIVNVNYTTPGEWSDENHNLTLQITDGTAQLVYTGEATLEGSDQGGIYLASVLAKATFPDSLDVEAGAVDTSTSAEGDPSVTWRDDFDKDGVEEAFYLSGATYDNYAEQTVYTELWYADASGTRYLESTEALDFSRGRVFDVGDCKLFCVEDNRTSTSETHVWTVRNGSPGRIQLAYGQQPGNVTQEDGRNFSFVFDAYDGASNGDGHTWKKYYMYWDGEGFTEYGGLRISEAQLRTVEGASQWLDEAIAIGGTIGDIFYRENGIVNVNYTTDGGWRDGTVDNNNLTLYVADGTAQLVYYDEATLQDSNHGGVYVANVLPKATFPDAFPFGGDSADVSGLLPAGYELLKQISTDLDGDGIDEQLAFSRVVESEYGDAHIDMRVFSAAGEMIQALELQAYSPYGNCAVRAYLLPAEEGQRLFVESLGFSGDVHSKYYCLFGYSDGRLSEEVFVQDPGYSDGVGLYLGNSEHMGVLEPAEELFYTDNPGPDYEEEYLKALEGVLGGYGISFEFTEGYSFYAGESGGAIPYGPFRYAKAILPTECIWQWGHAPSGATAVEDEEGFVPVSADLVFAQYEEYGPLGGGVEGAPMVAVNAGVQRWEEYADAMGGLVPLGGFTASASSYRASNRYRCDAACAFDGDASTAWNSNSSRSGQWLRVEWPQTQRIAGFTIVNGYAKDTGTWQKNSRVQLVSLYINGTDYDQSYWLDDSAQMQYFPLDGSIVCSSLLLRFDDTYAGDEYDDLCVTEICFYGYAGDTSAIGAGAAAQMAASVLQSVRTTGNVNLRSGPSTGNAKLDTVPDGSIIEYLGKEEYDSEGTRWLNVRYGSQEGWISAEYADLLGQDASNGSAQVPGTYVRATEGDTYLRSGPTLGYAILDVLYKNERAAFLGEVSTDARGVDWYKVNLDGREGWVSSRYTKLS